MRPIHLAVAGLHSFREKQEVDFAALCEGGVFGIFGPTGSGKSSLLDAMTLALYGKVERASNNTQGILNHAEDEVYVSFTFELGNASGTNRYKVERSFKRSGEYSLRTATCRIIEMINDESVVLADKMNDVNQTVQDLIGLTIDDFTRAVVLPQGKFAEFLSLKGSERRQMLQRLFHLEKYGDVLNQKLRDRYQKLSAEKATTIAEQTGLGDASKEALAEAKRKLEESELTLQATTKEFEKIETYYSESKQVWEWQLESEIIKQKLTTLKENEANVTMLEQRLANAKKAETVRPYLEEFELANEQVQSMLTKFEQIKEKLTKAQVEYDQAVQQYERAKLNRANHEQPLIIKIEQLTQAQEIQREITKAKLELEQLAKEITSKNSDLQAKMTALKATENARDAALTIEEQLKESLKQVQVPVSQREQIRAALEAKQKIDVMEAAKKQLSQDLTAKQLQLQDIQKQKLQQDEATRKLKQTVERFFAKTMQIYDRVVTVDRSFEMLHHAGNRLKKELQIELDQQKAKQLAAHLASQLKSGEACPVCGSTHHPNPIIATISNQDTITDTIEQLEQIIASGNERRHELKANQYKLQSVADALTEILTIEKVTDRSQSAVTLDSLQLDGNAVSTIAELKQLHETLVLECKGLYQDVIEVQEESRQTVLQVRDLEQKSLELTNTLQVLTNTVQELEEKLNQQSQQMTISLDAWQKQFAPMKYEEIEKEQQLITEMDRKATKITEELDSILPGLAAKEKEIESFKDAIAALQITLATLNSTYTEKGKKVAEQSEKLAKQIGSVGNDPNFDNVYDPVDFDIDGGLDKANHVGTSHETSAVDLDKLLQYLHEKLAALKENEQTALAAHNLKQQALLSLEKEYAVTKEAKETATIRQEKAKLKWEQVLKETPFETVEEVKQAFAAKNDLLSWEQEIQLYQEQLTGLNIEKERLAKQLQGRTLSDEQWHHIQAQKQSLSEKVSEARERKGAAVESLTEIERKHVRFNVLEIKRKELTATIEKVEKLQSVFRGNAFIEFIAEEQLITVSRDASERLGKLTRGRYAIEVNSEGGFVIRDDANGGVRRPVSTLSGGETFLTSLALALSLSAQIQLRGEYPLEFFFLDEGFGTLDQELLDIVITSLEKLHSDRLSVGVISHVQELRARLPRKLIVEPAEPSGKGSQVKLEKF